MRFFIAFFTSLLVYILFIWIYLTQFPQIKLPSHKKHDHVIKIDIRNISVPKKVVSEPTIKKKNVTAPLPKPIEKKVVKKKKKTIKKPIVKKKIIKKIKNKKVVKKKKKPKKIIKKKKIVKKKRPKKEEEIMYIEEPLLQEAFEVIEPKKEIKAKDTSNDLASFLSAPEPKFSVSKNFPNKTIGKLYGSSFHKFTPTQKKFIENNLNGIHQITQSILTQRGYPEGAGRTRQEGTNIVSFDLHPNGDISNLRLKKRIGYRSLDDNTLSLIRTAYKDYPHPSTTTKIIFYVTYSVLGY